MKMTTRNGGFSLIEVLVTILVVTLGLLGMAALQARFLVAEMESYQRSQALFLVQDMVDRIASNRSDTIGVGASATSPYVTGTSTGLLGTGNSAACANPTTQAGRDKCEWSESLKGVSEKTSSSNLGAMIGAKGCIEQISTMPITYRVSVAWQGLSKTHTPSLACGANSYGADDSQRRLISLNVVISKLIDD